MMSLLAVVMVACHSDDVRERLDAIKAVGDREPERAMKMIDTIRPEVERASEHTRMRCLLLDMRLRDKADRMPASDDSARKIALAVSSKCAPALLRLYLWIVVPY